MNNPNLLPTDLTLPNRTVSGHGMAARLMELAADFGPRGLLVHGRSLRCSGRLEKMLRSCPSDCRVMTYEHQGGEPDLD
ncbi:MAG: hypothetical protein ABR497_12345, partial [Kiritimatiellia bacterium]